MQQVTTIDERLKMEIDDEAPYTVMVREMTMNPMNATVGFFPCATALSALLVIRDLNTSNMLETFNKPETPAFQAILAQHNALENAVGHYVAQLHDDTIPIDGVLSYAIFCTAEETTPYTYVTQVYAARTSEIHRILAAGDQ